MLECSLFFFLSTPMGHSLFSHLRAMQAAVAVTVVTTAVLGLPLFAAEETESGLTDSHYANYIVKRFRKVGSETSGTFDNKTVATSGFDFAAFMSHTCFNQTKNDIASCKEEFGPYFNFKETYESGKLTAILSRVPYLAPAAQIVPTITVKAIVQPKAASGYPQQITRERSLELWKICDSHEDTREAAARCYQRNIRRTQEWSAAVRGNVH